MFRSRTQTHKKATRPRGSQSHLYQLKPLQDELPDHQSPISTTVMESTWVITLTDARQRLGALKAPVSSRPARPGRDAGSHILEVASRHTAFQMCSSWEQNDHVPLGLPLGRCLGATTAPAVHRQQHPGSQISQPHRHRMSCQLLGGWGWRGDPDSTSHNPVQHK